jgi:hypothetical protein
VIEMNKVPLTNQVNIPVAMDNSEVIKNWPVNNNLVSFKHYNLSRKSSHEHRSVDINVL